MCCRVINTIIKYLLFACNAVFAVCGIILLVVGVIYEIKVNNYTSQLDNVVYLVSPILLIVLGCVIFLISFFGCFGAIKENHCFLVTFGSILVVIIVLQIALCIFAFVQFQGAGDTGIIEDLENDLLKLVDSYHLNVQNKEAMDLIQETLQCCGAKDAYDYGLNETIPSTCCRNKPEVCTPTSAYTTGCGKELYAFIDDNIEIIGITAAVIAAFEIVSCVFAFIFASHVKNNRLADRYHYETDSHRS